MLEGHEPLNPRLVDIVRYATNTALANCPPAWMRESTRHSKNEILQKLGDLVITGRESDALSISHARSSVEDSGVLNFFGDVSSVEGDETGNPFHDSNALVE